MNNARTFALLPLAAMSALMTGCDWSSTSGTSGTLSLFAADTPVDSATSVLVTFTGVQLQGGSGGSKTFNFSPPRQIDLMATQNGNSAPLLDGVDVPSGNYQWISLMVDASQSSITLADGSVHALDIPSGSQSGLKLVSGFTVAAGGQSAFTIDFDLRKAITLASGSYILNPALRLIDNQQVGALAGSVDNTFAIGSTPITTDTCSPAVYVYSGADAPLVDINTTSSGHPVTTATLSLNNATGNYDYKAAFLVPGDYTLAVTCAGYDDSSATDTLSFSAAKNATVAADATTSVSFP
jgi:hypothetical protein